MRIQKELYRHILRWMFRDWQKLNISERRKRQKQLDRLINLSKAVNFINKNIGPVPVIEISPANYDKTVVYFHGGGYVIGVAKNHLNLCADIANRIHAQVILVEYRLAPEHPFPAALDDAMNVYNFILEKEKDTGHVFIGGDSAGGGLALSLLNEIKKAKLPMPAGAFCFSPWTDLTLSGSSIHENVPWDPILVPSVLAEDARKYAGPESTADPRLSPLFARLDDLPPILIQVGENELLLDDAKRYVEKARKASLPVKLEIWPDMYHVFQILPFLTEAQEALSHVTQFINRITMKTEIP